MIVYHSINNVNSIYTIIQLIIQIYLLFTLHRLIFDRSICNSFEIIKYMTHLAVNISIWSFLQKHKKKVIEKCIYKEE